MKLKHQKGLILSSLVVSAALFHTACNRASHIHNQEKYYARASLRQQTPAVEAQKSIEKLHIAVIPHQSFAEQDSKIQLLEDYLEDNLNLPVQMQITKDYQTSVDLLVEGKVNAAYLGAVTYIKARERNTQLEAILAPIEKSTGRPWYTSVIITKIESGIEEIADLSGKHFGFVNRSSTSGYLMPKAHFKSRGIEPEEVFTSIYYAGSHNKNLTALQSGIVDAIAIDKQTYLRKQESGEIARDKYQIIWESDPIPSQPIVVSRQLSSQLIVALKKALITAPEGLVDLDGSESAGYTLVQDEDYEPIRQMLTKL